MGLSFKKKNKKGKAATSELSAKKADDAETAGFEEADLNAVPNNNNNDADSTAASSKKSKPKRPTKPKFGSRRNKTPSPASATEPPSSSQQLSSPPAPIEPTIDMVPQLTEDLGSATDTSGEQSARALRMLFSLSEHSTEENNRAIMVQGHGGKLVPVLLKFLLRCERSSSEQYLALLVLNNVSIPAENKSPIAIEYGGAKVLSRLLCEDPSCHLLAIILVNLTFADGDLRRKLASNKSGTQLVEALSFALLVASSTPEEHNARTPITMDQEKIEDFAPRDLLVSAMKADALIHKTADGIPSHRQFHPDKQIFPETARWCLSALKNLTRPSRDSKVATAVADAGIIPLILRIITVGGPAQYEDINVHSNSDLARDLRMSEQQLGKTTETVSTAELSNSNPASPASATCPIREFHEETNATTTENTNLPSTWDANSIQDAALFTVMNLAAEAPVRFILRDGEAMNILSAIADFATMRSNKDESTMDPIVGEMQQQFQCLKARMTLAYLVGSEGHFGQPRDNNNSGTQMDESVLLVTNSEAEKLIELLSNTLHLRSKEGAGGYSAATFSVKSVLYAIRCLLTNHINQITFATTGVRLNCLLMKAICYFTLNRVPTVDAEAAEYACFSLYLQSNYGFKDNFLPSFLGPQDKEGGSENEANSDIKPEKTISITERLLSSMLKIENITAPGRHAATQILLRLPYLKFGGSLEELHQYYGISSLSALDFDLDEDIREEINAITIERTEPGAKPMNEIFGRPILRSRAPKKGSDGAPWNQQTSVSIFPSALLAVQPLSFGSVKVRHLEPIDDILIANNVTCSANGEKTESYNYWWSWQDAAPSIQEKLKRKQPTTLSKSLMAKVNSIQGDDDGPFTFFGLKCGQGGFCKV